MDRLNRELESPVNLSRKLLGEACKDAGRNGFMIALKCSRAEAPPNQAVEIASLLEGLRSAWIAGYKTLSRDPVSIRPDSKIAAAAVEKVLKTLKGRGRLSLTCCTGDRTQREAFAWRGRAEPRRLKLWSRSQMPSQCCSILHNSALVRLYSTGHQKDILRQVSVVIEDDADQGKMVILPDGIEPTFIVETSRTGDTVNRQFHFVLEQAISAQEGEALCGLTQRKCGGDTGGKDQAHV